MTEYNVLYGCNDGYAPFAGISICSLMENNKDADTINVYVMSDAVSEENQDLLKRQVEKYGKNRHLSVVDSKEIIDGFRDLGVPDYRESYTTYLRIAFDKVIPPNVKRLLYLDSDTLVMGSLSEIFELDMGENYFAVVTEALQDSVRPLIDYKKDEIYFNAGVILFNVPLWKRECCAERIFKMMKNRDIKNPSGGDQDYLNYISKGKKTIISPMYNLQPVHMAFTIRQYRRCFHSEAYYDDRTLEYGIGHPVILHTYRFLGMFPWNKNSMHPCAGQFKKYKDISEWKGLDDIGKNLSFIYKLERILYVILPKTCFLKLFAVVHKRSIRKGTAK